MQHPLAARPTLSALALASLWALGPMAWASEHVPVPTLRLQAHNTAGQRQWEGVIQPVRQSTVAAQTGGNIVALLVKAGDTVKAGQVLARIDERDTQAGLRRSQADVAQAEAQLANATLQWERSQALKAQGFVSAAALDSAQAQWRSAQASVAAAQAARAQAALAKGFATVLAPFDGRVLSTLAEVGDLATPGRPLLALYAPSPLRAVVQVPASQAEQVRSAGNAEVLITAAPAGQGSWVRATSTVALPSADAVSQTVEWRLELPALATLSALPGQTVRVRFAGMAASGNTPPSLGAPASAVLHRGELTAVYVVREGHFVLQAVRAGTPAQTAQGSAFVPLFSGVQAGDVIAVDAVRAGLANALPAQP